MMPRHAQAPNLSSSIPIPLSNPIANLSANRTALGVDPDCTFPHHLPDRVWVPALAGCPNAHVHTAAREPGTLIRSCHKAAQTCRGSRLIWNQMAWRELETHWLQGRLAPPHPPRRPARAAPPYLNLLMFFSDTRMKSTMG